MPSKDVHDLRDILIDAHAHFFFLKGLGATRVRLWQILPDAIVIDPPKGAPLRQSVLGYIPTIDGNGVYEIDGHIDATPMPDAPAGTVRIIIDPDHIHRMNRRLYPRHHFAPPIAGVAKPDPASAPVPIRIVNVSAGGLRVESETTLSPTHPYRFEFTLEMENGPVDLTLPGLVVYEVPMESGHAYGIRFGRTGDDDTEAPVEDLDQTVDLLGIVNRLLVREI